MAPIMVRSIQPVAVEVSMLISRMRIVTPLASIVSTAFKR
jgi:hypothetical protein